MELDSEKWHQVNSILVVDDDDNWCYLSKRILENAGFNKDIFTAKNGKTALQILETARQENQKLPELIFLDIKMPVMDGFEFLEEVTQSGNLDPEQTKIYMCSSSFNPQDKEKANQYPIAGYITKPLTNEILEDILKENN